MNRILLALITISLAASCTGQRMALPKPPEQPPPPPRPELDYTDVREQSFRTRIPIPVEENRYEGSLWKDESSWGNLLRDHRARFQHDVVTIVNVNDLIVIPEKEKGPIAANPNAANPLEAAAGQANRAFDIMQNVLGGGPEQIEKEQNEVLASLKTLSARVASVLPNGNMVILAEKVDYRQGNSVRYVTKIKGVIRPEDVTDKNEIAALKMARSEVQIKRQIQSQKLNLGALAPLVGRQSAGLLDRLSHMATPGKAGSSSTSTVGTAQ